MSGAEWCCRKPAPPLSINKKNRSHEPHFRNGKPVTTKNRRLSLSLSLCCSIPSLHCAPFAGQREKKNSLFYRFRFKFTERSYTQLALCLVPKVRPNDRTAPKRSQQATFFLPSKRGTAELTKQQQQQNPPKNRSPRFRPSVRRLSISFNLSTFPTPNPTHTFTIFSICTVVPTCPEISQRSRMISDRPLPTALGIQSSPRLAPSASGTTKRCQRFCSIAHISLAPVYACVCVCHLQPSGDFTA